ncbi:MAG: hypothetical protein KC731_07505 [Myxococcales bacterium]|nr:hypothetical protein [Myxococcales bacterium]
MARPALAVVTLLLLTACGDSGSSSTSGGGGGGASSSTGGGATTGSGGSGASGSGGGGVGGSGAGGEAPVADVHLVGRFDSTQTSSWSGSAIRTRVSGGPVDITLDAPAGLFFEVEVDGASQGIFTTTAGEQSYPVANAPSGAYDLLVFRRVEGFFGNARFVGISPAASLVPTAWPYDHRIEYIGDSISCGYGALGPNESCNFSADTESAYVSYATVAARAVNAAPHIIAYSGKGVFQNYGGNKDELMPELYLRTLTNDAGSTWGFDDPDPDVVVINLGTNDFSATIAENDFVSAYVGLLTTVRQHRPNATIYTVRWEGWGSTHMSWVSSAVAQFGDADVHETDFSIDPNDGWGCDYHPSEATHAKLGAQLAATLKSDLGW